MSQITVDFGHRTVQITKEDVRNWRPWNDETITAACKALRLKADHPGARASAQEIVEDIANQIPGCTPFNCDTCGARTFGSERLHDSEDCTECDELAGLDNEVNDSDEPMDDDVKAAVQELLETIQKNGGDPAKALRCFPYLA